MTAQMFQQHLAAAQALMLAHNARGAIERLKEALAISPGHPHALAFMAACQTDLRLLREAKATAEAGLTTDPDYAPLHQALGMALLQMRDLITAERHIRKAVEINPADAMSHALLAQVLTASNSNEEAAKAIEKAQSLAPNDVRVLTLAASTFVNANRYEDAERAAKRAYTLAPDHAGTLITNGLVALRRGRTEEAEEFAALAASSAAGTRSAHILFAQIQMARTRWLKPIWYAMNGVLGMPYPVRAVVLAALIAGTVFAFAFLERPLYPAVGWVMLALTLAFALSLRVGDAVVSYLVARHAKTTRLKKGF